jgi:hypothetical protein
MKGRVFSLTGDGHHQRPPLAWEVCKCNGKDIFCHQRSIFPVNATPIRLGRNDFSSRKHYMRNRDPAFAFIEFWGGGGGGEE